MRGDAPFCENVLIIGTRSERTSLFSSKTALSSPPTRTREIPTSFAPKFTNSKCTTKLSKTDSRISIRVNRTLVIRPWLEKSTATAPRFFQSFSEIGPRSTVRPRRAKRGFAKDTLDRLASPPPNREAGVAGAERREGTQNLGAERKAWIWVYMEKSS